MKPPRFNEGSTLPAALGVVLLLTIVTGIAFQFTSTTSRHTQGAGAVESAIAVADGSIDYLYAHWRQIARSTATGAPTTAQLATIAPPGATYFPQTKTAAVTNFGVIAVDPLLQPLSTTTTTPPRQLGRGPGIYNYTYLASADVSVQTINRTVTQRVRRVFQKKIQSPWNFAMFYQDVLELQPSAPLTLTGWVHSNDNIYTASDKVTLTDRLTTAGSWNIGYAPGDGAHTSTSASPNYPSNQPPSQEDNFQAFGLDAKLLNTTDSNPNNDSLREIAQVPNSNFPDPFADQRYYNQAGIKVLINGNNRTILNAVGTVCTLASKGNDLAIYQAVDAAIKNSTNFQDNREAATMSAWNVDIAPIVASNISWNNILYVSDQTANGSDHKALRLKNGRNLPKQGLTFVSDNPVYVHGDWNTGDSPASSASTPDSTKPLGSGYTWRPSAIVADAITLLSNAWQDSNANKGLNNRVASNTTVNAALVAGNVPTGSKGSNYSGGGENFVRFLEDWTGKTFTYYGSMIQLYASAYATGTWGRANVYAPAQLKWHFDDNFTLNAPAGSAVMVSYVQQRWFQE